MSITETNAKIIECLSAGKVYKQVAVDTGLKVTTIKKRIKVLKKKLNCNTIAQLVIEYRKVY